MTIDYSYWRKALAGEKPKMFVDEPQCGFYRDAIREQMPLKNGQGMTWKRVGWRPVAIFNAGSTIAAAIDGATMIDSDKINVLWSHCAGNPISEETYRAVAERGEPWPDSHEVASIPVANSSASMPAPEGATGASPHNVISDKIDAATRQLTAYANIESDEQSSKARSLQQEFLDLRSQAAKHYEEGNRPLLDEQKRIRGVWFPLRDSADAASDALRKAMGAWEDVKRKAAQVAAERAEAGQEVRSNVPPPSTQIKGGTGKAANVSVAVFVTAIDEDKVFAQFKGNPELTALLTALAQKAIRAGIQVPGATTEERSVVR